MWKTHDGGFHVPMTALQGLECFRCKDSNKAVASAVAVPYIYSIYFIHYLGSVVARSRRG